MKKSNKTYTVNYLFGVYLLDKEGSYVCESYEDFCFTETYEIAEKERLTFGQLLKDRDRIIKEKLIPSYKEWEEFEFISVKESFFSFEYHAENSRFNGYKILVFVDRLIKDYYTYHPTMNLFVTGMLSMFIKLSEHEDFKDNFSIRKKDT